MVRLADSARQDLSLMHTVGFGPRAARLRLNLPVRYPASLRLVFENAYSHPSEGASLRVFTALARHATCVCDIGAHVGLYTYAAASARQSRLARVYAFEPLPDLCRTIQRNIERNRLGAVRAVAAAVGGEAGRAELCVPADMHYATLHRDWLAQARIEDFAVISVEVVALDQFFADHPSSSLPDLVKIDVEGHEQYVLDGMHHILATSHPDLIVELIGASRSLEIVRWLRTELGYRVYFISAVGLRELAEAEPPPVGELHNFLLSCRDVGELRSLLRMPVVGSNGIYVDP
jgi:FkbM family methyltransferase